MLSFHIQLYSSSFLSSYSILSKFEAKSEKFIRLAASLMNSYEPIGISLEIRSLTSSVSAMILSLSVITFAMFC